MAKGDAFRKIGYKVSGTSFIEMWDGSTGWISMNEYLIPKEQLSKEFLLQCVNDGKYECKKILKAKLIIEDLYLTGRTEFNRIITIKWMPYRHKLFRRGY